MARSVDKERAGREMESRNPHIVEADASVLLRLTRCQGSA